MMLQRKEENNADLAAIQGFAMYDLLVQLTKLPENVLDDEEAGGFVGGPRLVTAMRAARAKMQKDGDFLGNNRREIQALPPDQAADILRFLAQDSEGKGQKSINTDLEVDVTIVAPSAIQLRGEQQGGLQGEGAARGGHELSTDHISEFEEGLLNDRSAITGVVLDPESREIIGYRTLRADGISRLVDREGAFVVDAGTPLGLQPPVVDPIDFTPNPAALAKGAAKAGVGIVGKVVLSGAVKKGAASGGK